VYYPEKGVLPNSNTYFALISNTARTMYFYLDRVGHYYCDKNYAVTKKGFEDFQLMYIREGSGSIRNGNKTMELKAGNVVLTGYLPYVYSTDQKWETVWFYFNGCSSRQIFDYLYEKTAGVIDIANSMIVPKYINKILSVYENGEPACEPIISCHIQRLLSELIMITSKNSYNTHNEEPSPSMEAINYIESNFSNRLTLEEISEKVSMSAYYFSRVFKKETGYTPYEYILSVRINQSKNLLKCTRMSVKEIGYKVGFNSESNFVHTFRKRTGMTPNDFRVMPV
jgi:AraC family transcriptional regulator